MTALLRNLHAAPFTESELGRLLELLEDPCDTRLHWAALGAYANHLAETLGWFDSDHLRP